MEAVQHIPAQIPVFPLREQVIFPFMVLPIFIGSEQMPVVYESLREGHLLGIFSSTDVPSPGFEHLSSIGTVCRIKQIVKFPEGGCKLAAEGLKRIRLTAPSQQTPFMAARVEVLEEKQSQGLVSEALVQSVNALLKVALAYGRPLPADVVKMIDRIEAPGRLADLVAVYLGLELVQQQKLLEILDPMDRLKEVYTYLADEVQKLQVKEDVQTEVTRRMGRNQKEYFLREQMKEIQQELGEADPRQEEISEFRRGIDEGDMPDDVRKVADRELVRLERISPSSPEYTVSRNYLEYLCTVPWKRGTQDNLDIAAAQLILDEDHHSLVAVKERILEYLAVRSLRETTRGPILCFAGPPGVGKTSLGRSIARAMGRRFIRVSLGGMKDEAEIRGHRRTYIGALPGRIIQEICRCESNNPVFMLDEVDKIGQDFRGDPASALLEVLDPEQNDSFTDHYLDVPFDLSRVMFICTANVMDTVPYALKDRMEVVYLPGYSDEEKVEIAYRFLIPKECEENGLGDLSLSFEPQALQQMVRSYTREAGVRGLERQIAAVCRKIAKEITTGKPPRKSVTVEGLEDLLGPKKYFSEVAGEEDRIGVVTGLAWTEAGGDIIFVEASSMPGAKDLVLTGSLGNVMQESAKTALSFIRARCQQFGIDPSIFERCDIHIHVPSGAIPKDGPSAGITIATALISLLTGRPARRDVAMTGELTLTGRILPIGGVKEKVLAARRAGVMTVLLPRQNVQHLEELDEEIRREMAIVAVESVEDVVACTLAAEPSVGFGPATEAEEAFLVLREEEERPVPNPPEDFS